MLRLLLISSLCTLFLACSSEDNSAALNEWFNDRGLATSYGKDSMEIKIPMNEINFDSSGGFDSSAYRVDFYAVLGNTNSMEHILYFGLEWDSLSFSDTLKLRADSIFHADTPLNATVYWLIEPEFQHDSLWLEFQNKFTDSAVTTLERKTEAFFVPLPEKLLELRPSNTLDTLRLLVGIRLHSDNTVLRIVPPDTTDIPGLLRVAHKVNKLSDCKQCLHVGVNDSLRISFEINDENKNAITAKTVVFAQLVLPKQSDAKGGELGLPVPVSVYGENGLENYRVDTTYVGDSLLTLQVTKSLRSYVATADSLTFVLKLEVPLQAFSTYNGYYAYVSNFRPAYVRYDFGSAVEAGKAAKLKLWFADYGDKK